MLRCSTAAQLEFLNVDEMETMATGEHFMATDIEWDPTGRYIATSVTHVHQVGLAEPPLLLYNGYGY